MTQPANNLVELQPEDASDPSWYYPLIPNVSPCYRSEHGFFLFPDLEKNDGSAVGIVLAEGIDEIVLDILVQVLRIVVKQGGIIDVAPRTRRNVSSSISQSIVKGAFYVSKGLVREFSR